MAGFLTLVFATGGSSRLDVPLLFVLRPVAVLATAWALATIPRERWWMYRYPTGVIGAALVLTLLHLVPLPPTIWHGLPGFGAVQRIDAVAGLADQWRPLSLVPSRTINAAWSLTVPLAALLLSIRLTATDRVRILYVLLILGSVSAAIGLLQSAGVPISLFHTFDDPKRIEAAGLFANQNHQAALLAIMLPMLAVATKLAPRDRGKAADHLMQPLAIGGMAVIALLLVVTGSRAGLVLGLVALLFVVFYDLLRIDLLDRLSRRRAAGIRLTVAVSMAGVAALVATLATRALSLSRLETVGADLRPRLWASIMPILPDYQPWGSGIGSYVEVYRIHEPFALLRATYSNHAHNEYLEITLTAGLPGVILLLVAAALLGWTLWRHRRGSAAETLFARLGATTMVILALASITDYPVRTPLLAAIMALAAAWSVGAPGAHKPGNARA